MATSAMRIQESFEEKIPMTPDAAQEPTKAVFHFSNLSDRS